MTSTNAAHLGPPTASLDKSELPELPELLRYDLSNISINTTVPGLPPGDQDQTIKKSLTQAMILYAYPLEKWTHVYTDGSATAAI